jgi:predicted PurR-regulated permease PerM
LLKGAGKETQMFSLDDRTGNIVTTVMVFAVATLILYLARGAFFILLLSLFFAYLLDPAVTLVHRHSRLGHKNRTWAVAQVYLIGTILIGGLGYAFGPHLVAQMKSLNAVVPGILEDVAGGRPGATPLGGHALSVSQQVWIQDWLARHHDFIVQVFERGAASVGYVAASAIWLLAVPILAIFILRDGRQTKDAFLESVERRGGRARLAGILRRVDTMLAKYIRSQLALAGLSFIFYSVSMFVLGFPYAIALGVLGGVLEFLPMLGWIVAAAVMLTTGFLTHAHWIWMAALVIVWRLVQDYVNSPRIMGDNLELQPLTVIFALMVGGQVGGIAGVYLSVPAVAVLKIVWLEYSSRNSPAAVSDQPLGQMKG